MNKSEKNKRILSAVLSMTIMLQIIFSSFVDASSILNLNKENLNKSSTLIESKFFNSLDEKSKVKINKDRKLILNQSAKEKTEKSDNQGIYPNIFDQTSENIRNVYTKVENGKNYGGYISYKGDFEEKDIDVASLAKYAEKTDKENEYIINLKIKGNTVVQETEESLGIVVVYDNSNSMEKNDRVTKARKSTEEFVKKVLSQNKKSKVALVSYGSEIFDGRNSQLPLIGSDSSIYNIWDHSYKEFTNDPQKIINKLPKKTPNQYSSSMAAWGGTFTGGALQEAKNIIDKHKATKEKLDKYVIISITDGVPTKSLYLKSFNKLGEPQLADYRSYDESYSNIIRNTQKTGVKGYGKGYNLKESQDGIYIYRDGIHTYQDGPYYQYNYKKKSWEYIKNHGQTTLIMADKIKKDNVEIYCLGIEVNGREFSDYPSRAYPDSITKEEAVELLSSISSGKGNYYEVENVNDLSSKLNTIVNKFTKNTIDNGSIIDPMGENIELVENYIDGKNYKIEGFNTDVSKIKVDYDIKSKTFKITNLNLGKDQEVKLTYRVRLKEEAFDNKYHPTNKETVLYRNKDSSKLQFKVPSVKYSYKKTKGMFKIIKKNKDGNLLKGAEFKLTKSDGSKVENGLKSTDQYGKIIYDNLEPGEYKLVEEKPPVGYKENKNTTWNIKISQNGDAIDVKVVKLEKIEIKSNEPKKIQLKENNGVQHQYTTLSTMKVDLNWVGIPKSNRRDITVGFTGSYVYRNYIYMPDQTYLANNTRYYPLRFISGENSKTWKNLRHTAAHYYSNYYYGQYPVDYLVKVESGLNSDWRVHYDYFPGEDRVKITIFKADNTIAENITPLGKDNSFEILNEYKKYDIEFTKIKRIKNIDPNVEEDNIDTNLAGAKFRIEKKVKPNNQQEKWIQIGKKVESDKNGKVKFLQLEPGTYRIIETVTPEGLIKPNKSVKEFILKADGQLTKLDGSNFEEKDKTIVNTPLGEGKVKVHKFGEDGDSKGLNGVKFKLTSVSSDGLVFTDTTKRIDREDGIIEFKNLPNGQYVLEEISGPKGYIISDKKYDVIIGGKFDVPEVNKDGTVTHADGTQSTPQDVTTKVSLREDTKFIKPTQNSNVIVPNQTESFRINNKFAFVDGIKAGDYFYINYSDNVDVSGIEPNKNADLRLVGGSGILAKGKFEPENHRIKYTFTKYLDNYNATKADSSVTFYIDKKKVLESGNIRVIQFLNKDKPIEQTYYKDMYVDYSNPPIYGYYSANMKAHIAYHDPLTEDNNYGDYKYYIYVNPRYIYAGNINVNILKGHGGDYNSSIIDLTKANIKIYSYKNGNEAWMPSSFGFDTSKLNDVTNYYKNNINKIWNGVNINFGDIGKRSYIIEVDGKYDKKSKNDLKIQSNVESWYKDNYGYMIKNQASTYSFVRLYENTSSADLNLTINIKNNKNKIKFTKVDGSKVDNNQAGEGQGQHNSLQGAKFELRKKKGNTFEKVQDSEKTTGTDGKFGWKGLDEGEYQVWEIQAPKDYILRGHVASFKVDERGNIKDIKDKDGKDLNGNMKIENFKAEYPKTGGNGTLIFTSFGILLMILAFFINKDKNFTCRL